MCIRDRPLEDALALFERNLGHPLGDEQPVAEAICQALEGVPLSIVKAARTAGLRRVPLAQVLQEVQPGDREARPPVEQLFWMLGQHLSAGERRVLAAIAAPGGPSVSRAALAHISEVAPPKLQEYLARLEKLGLLHVEAAEGEAERYSLDEGLRAYVRRHAADEGMLARAAAYYLQFSGALRARSRHPDEENVVWALNYYGDRGQWREVLRIVRGMEAYLVASGRWGQWRKRLENAWRAGSELNDPTTEAWAQNQLGIVALAAGDSRRATQLFRGALRIWRAIGDRTGAAIARWNLQLLVGPPPPPERGEPEPAPDTTRRWVESRPDRAGNVRGNAAGFDLAHRMAVAEGRGTEVLAGLPAPDAVFVGGGADPAGIDTVWHLLPPGARLVVNTVTLESEALHGAGGDLQHGLHGFLHADGLQGQRLGVLGHGGDGTVGANEEHVEGDVGVLHPHRNLLLRREVEQHAFAVGQLLPVHQSGGFLFLGRRHLDREHLHALLGHDLERRKARRLRHRTGAENGGADRREQRHDQPAAAERIDDGSEFHGALTPEVCNTGRP